MWCNLCCFHLVSLAPGMWLFVIWDFNGHQAWADVSFAVAQHCMRHWLGVWAHLESLMSFSSTALVTVYSDPWLNTQSSIHTFPSCIIISIGLRARWWTGLIIFNSTGSSSNVRMNCHSSSSRLQSSRIMI